MKSLNACSSSIRQIGVFMRYFLIFHFYKSVSIFRFWRPFKLKWKRPPSQLRKKEITIFSWYKTQLKLYKHGNHIKLEWFTKMNATWKLLKAYLKIPYLLCSTLPWNSCQLSTGRHSKTFLENGEYHGTSQYVWESEMTILRLKPLCISWNQGFKIALLWYPWWSLS